MHLYLAPKAQATETRIRLFLNFLSFTKTIVNEMTGYFNTVVDRVMTLPAALIR